MISGPQNIQTRHPIQIYGPYGITACEKIFKGVPNVAVFDTAFHQTMPDCAAMYAIDPKYYKKMGIRKYGFHGTSHKFIVQEAAKFLKKPVEKVNLVTCHMGNGSSLSAVKNGQCIDTTMGLTPLAGMVMGRSRVRLRLDGRKPFWLASR